MPGGDHLPGIQLAYGCQAKLGIWNRTTKPINRAKMRKDVQRCRNLRVAWGTDPNLARNCVLLIVFWLAHGIARIKVGSVWFVLFLGSKSDQKSETKSQSAGRRCSDVREILVVSQIYQCSINFDLFLGDVFHSKIQAGRMFFNMEIWIVATGGVTVAAAPCLASLGIL